jgi:predicted nuclease with TOPRIM domain
LLKRCLEGLSMARRMMTVTMNVRDRAINRYRAGQGAGTKQEECDVNDRLRERLSSLQSEYEAGQKMLAELDAKRASITGTLLRIEGAIQVLRELLNESTGQAVDEQEDRKSTPPPTPMAPNKLAIIPGDREGT